MSQSLPPYGGAPVPPVPYQRDHPSAVTVLVLGIVGLVVCQVVSPFAWAKGNGVLREIDASGGQLGGRTMANAGRICGIIGTCLLVLSVVVLGLLLTLGLATSSEASYSG